MAFRNAAGKFTKLSKTGAYNRAKFLKAQRVIAAANQRSKLGNQIQKGLREGSPGVKLPDDPFQGFREPSPAERAAKIQEALGDQVKRSATAFKSAVTRAQTPRTSGGAFAGPDPVGAAERRLVQDARLAARTAQEIDPSLKAAPDLDHLRRENAIPATPPKPNADPRRAGDMRNSERELVRATLFSSHPARLEEITANTPAKGKFTLASVPVDLGYTGDDAAMEAARQSPTAISPYAAAGRLRRRIFETREAAIAAAQEFDEKHGTKYAAAVGSFEDQHPRHPAGTSKGGEFAPKK